MNTAFDSSPDGAPTMDGRGSGELGSFDASRAEAGRLPSRGHLLSVADLDRAGIEELLHLARSFAEVSSRPIPRVPALRGKTVVTAFFEPSTRTRLSFEAAAKRLSADTMTFTAASSSLSKGESVRDTVETLEAIGADALVVRHSGSGVPAQVSRWVSAAVVNAGDGCHEHPTQALLDCYTVREELVLDGPDGFCGLKIVIVGDIAHSRVARSEVLAFHALGAEVVLVGPGTLLPVALDGWPVSVSEDLDACLGDADVVYMLRLQSERMSGSFVPSLREYASRYGLDAKRARQMRKGAIIMHPGPMNRGVEISAEVVAQPNCVVTDQVRNGVALRMAVLYSLLGGERA